MEWTPEPWEVVPDNGWLTIRPSNDKTGLVAGNIGGTYAVGGQGHEANTANAQRIVDCVNGCADINPKAVGKLLEACKYAAKIIEAIPNEYLEAMMELELIQEESVDLAMIQQAIAQKLIPVFDKHFSEASYGFRPG